MVKILAKYKGNQISFMCSGKCDNRDVAKISNCPHVVFIPNLKFTEADFLCSKEGECEQEK